jgi:molybdopterin-dependent oxidoreductase alpha subunit
MDPDRVVFYTSGRASLETSYMLQLFARMYGTNNLPDSSNMCHESSSVGLKEAIGVGVGTIMLEDFEKTDLMFFFGQNVGTNSPRMLHPLQDSRKRGVPIITFNPLREPGLISFTNPQSPVQMLSPTETQISTQYHQVKTGGDTAAILGLCKVVIAADDAALAAGGPRVLDDVFIREHTHGFEDFADFARQAEWTDIERVSGLSRADIKLAADEYIKANAVIIHYGMGLTQHRMGVQNVRMLCNFLLLRGNIGKPGAGPSPVRGHSNVQGQRTVGITEKPELAPLDKLAQQFSFEPPRKKGMNIVEAFEGMEPPAPHSQCRHQAQPEPSRARRRVLYPAVSEPHRVRPAGERRPGCVDGRQYRLHARLPRRDRSGQHRRALGTVYHRRDRQGDARGAFDGRLERMARRLQPGARRDR